MSISETLDRFLEAREEDPITKGELSPGELIAVAKYHLEYVVTMAASGQSGNDQVIEHLEECLMCVAQALVSYRKNVNDEKKTNRTRSR